MNHQGNLNRPQLIKIKIANKKVRILKRISVYITLSPKFMNGKKNNFKSYLDVLEMGNMLDKSMLDKSDRANTAIRYKSQSFTLKVHSQCTSPWVFVVPVLI